MSVEKIDLLKSIQKQKCALIVGPNACLSADGKTTFASKIAVRLQGAGKPVFHYAHDDLYFIELNADRTWASSAIDDEFTAAYSDFANPGFHQPLYDLLSDLPFHLVLNLSPDNFLYEWMRHKGIAAQLASFSAGEAIPAFDPPTAANPLIYNLLGDTRKAESLVLTQEDFYKYLSEVFTNPRKLEALRTELRKVDYLLFIGVSLERWYVKLIMLLFEINSNSKYISVATFPQKDASFMLPAPPFGVSELADTEDFCYKHFKIKFVEHDFLQYLQQLYQVAVAEQQQPRPAIQLRNRVVAATPPAAFAPKQQVAIAYATDARSNDLATDISKKMIRAGYEVFSEKVSLGYRGKVSEFIQQLGGHQVVILVLSDAFLKEKDCMRIALEMEKQRHFAERIFPVLIADATIYDAHTRLAYIQYWGEKAKKLNDSLTSLDDIAYTSSITDELNQCKDIRRFIDQFMAIVKDMKLLMPDAAGDIDLDVLLQSVQHVLPPDALNGQP